MNIAYFCAMRKAFSPEFFDIEAEVVQAVANFNSAGEKFVEGKRNTIRVFAVGPHKVNIKSFRVPNFLNSILYRFVRKSKARRSFEFAMRLRDAGIGTPTPIGYIEKHTSLGIGESYYASEHLAPDLTFRELVAQPNFPDHENILRQFTAFSFLLHEKGIEFLDHSPGNTLIKKAGKGNYDFFLVDLNRMKFDRSLSLEARMKNLSRLTPKMEMVAVMSNEYAKLSGAEESVVFESLWRQTSEFQRRFHRKKALKKKYLGK